MRSEVTCSLRRIWMLRSIWVLLLVLRRLLVLANIGGALITRVIPAVHEVLPVVLTAVKKLADVATADLLLAHVQTILHLGLCQSAGATQYFFCQLDWVHDGFVLAFAGVTRVFISGATQGTVRLRDGLLTRRRVYLDV